MKKKLLSAQELPGLQQVYTHSKADLMLQSTKVIPSRAVLVQAGVERGIYSRVECTG